MSYFIVNERTFCKVNNLSVFYLDENTFIFDSVFFLFVQIPNAAHVAERVAILGKKEKKNTFGRRSRDGVGRAVEMGRAERER